MPFPGLQSRGVQLGGAFDTTCIKDPGKSHNGPSQNRVNGTIITEGKRGSVPSSQGYATSNGRVLNPGGALPGGAHPRKRQAPPLPQQPLFVMVPRSVSEPAPPAPEQKWTGTGAVYEPLRPK